MLGRLKEEILDLVERELWKKNYWEREEIVEIVDEAVGKALREFKRELTEVIVYLLGLIGVIVMAVAVLGGQ